MGTVHDHSSLKWIRGELDTLIVQARNAFESYVEGSGSEDQVDECIRTIHEINGTLLLVQLYGGVQLTEELELIVTAIRDDQVSNKEDAAEVVMLGIIQMSEYLEKIDAGVQDNPLILLPVLNELRAARDAELLSELAFFTPNLEKDFTSGSVTGKVNPELQELALRLRHKFHKGLLKWLRKSDPEGGLRRIGNVMRQLAEAAGTDQVKQLFEVGYAVTSALAEGSIESSVAMKKLFTRLDHEIKRIIEHSEQSVAEAPDKDLLKNLLYYVACADSQNELLQDVRQEFGLQETLADHKEILQDREGLHAPGRSLLESVQSAISTDLIQVKDSLDLFIRSKSEDLDRLHVLESPLRKLADTLGMVGMGNLRQKLKRQADRIEEIVQSGELPDEQDLMSMAGDILYVETSLENIPHLQQVGVSSQARDSMLPEGESEKLLESVIHEAQLEMVKSKDAVTNYIVSPDKPALLQPVIQQFHAIEGAFRMLDLHEPAEMMADLSVYANNVILKQSKVPAMEELNTFADAVTSIEYFMESIVEGIGINTEILDVARQALDELGAVPAGSEDIDISLADEPEPGVEQFTKATVEHIPVPEPVDEKTRLEEIDPEILEIFIEEAREEIEVIDEYLSQWRDNQENLDALTTFRRSFHTLKGSGRLVGAETIGELAWSVENLLNRVIDGTAMVSPEILTLLVEALAVLPALVDAQEAGELPKVDVKPLMERAFALASPEPVETSEDEAEADNDPFAVELLPTDDEADSAVTTEVPAPEEALPPPIALDPTLFDIFHAESMGHIATLKSFLDECRKTPSGCEALKNVTRALHTLHGSANAATVTPLAELGGALEEYFGSLQEHGLVPDEPVLEVLEQGIRTVELVLKAINVPAATLPPWEELVDEINARKHALGPPADTSVAREDERRADEAEAQLPDLDSEEELESVSEVEDSTPISYEVTAPEPVEISGFMQLEADPDLVEIFLDEARELSDEIEHALHAWQSHPEDIKPVADLKRSLHTLKGGARLAGAMPIGDLSHNFESLLSAVDHGQIGLSEAVITLAQTVADRLNQQIEDLATAPQVRIADDLIGRIEEIVSGVTYEEPAAPQLEPDSGEIESESATEEAEEKPVQAYDEERGETLPERKSGVSIRMEPAPVPTNEAAAAVTGRSQVRVASELLDKLVNNAGEVSIFRSRLEQQNSELGFNLREMQQTVDRLRKQLRHLEIETETQILFRYERDVGIKARKDKNFDPLEMDRFSTMQQISRSLMETVNDLTNINGFLDDLQRDTDTLLIQQSRIMTDLQDGLMRTRMVPFSQIVPRIQRLIRQTCAPMGKRAVLRVVGAEGVIDRSILDRMIGPLEHMLRNSISHGIETPEERKTVGKDETGHISFDLTREGDDVILTITDDGRGIDPNAIRQRAIDRGLLDADADVSDNDVLPLLFDHGFSTAEKVTQIAGRGVGLDVVLSEVKQLGGSLDIASELGQGTSFTVRLPLTLSITDALLVELGDEIYAIPHTSLKAVVRLTREDLRDRYELGQPTFSYAGEDYHLRYLGDVIGIGKQDLTEQRKWYQLILIRSGEHRVALQVDGLLGNRQIVVKSVGPQISTVRWISGGTILGDGRVALILDLTALVRMDLIHTPVHTERVEKETGTGRTVMVVDDSITVRKVTGRLLERHGMNVLTAKDGVDAITQLQDQKPDIMLLDIEMPRMDGYELARQMRSSEGLKNIPIIMITSRTGDKHRRLALELGVKRYLGKPYQETELLENLYAVLAEAEAAQ